MYGNGIESKVQSSQGKAFYYDWGDKRKIEIEVVGNTHVSEVLRGLEKTLVLVYYIWRGL